MLHEHLRHLWIRLRLTRWLGPSICALPYLGSIVWLVAKGQLWIAMVMLSPALVLSLLITLAWLLARLEFGGRWRG